MMMKSLLMKYGSNTAYIIEKQTVQRPYGYNKLYPRRSDSKNLSCVKGLNKKHETIHTKPKSTNFFTCRFLQ